MDKNKATILLVLTLAVNPLAGTVESTEPAFKQEPPDHLRSYFAKTPMPKYPKAASTWHKHGSGWFRLNIDAATGVVTSVKVLKSTGVKILDDSAAAAFMQWRAKPHLIDHAILPVQFVGMSEEYGPGIKW